MEDGHSIAMYRWSDDDGILHIMDQGWLGPAKTSFGYSSLCEGNFVAPREGIDFSLTQRTDGDIECQECRNAPLDRWIDEYAIFNGHCIEISRDEKGDIRIADLLCSGHSLQDELEFYLDEVSPDIIETECVCGGCWKAYELRDWGPNDWGGQFEIEVQEATEGGVYYADSMKTISIGRDTIVELTSSKGFTRQFKRDEIESISVQTTGQVNY